MSITYADTSGPIYWPEEDAHDPDSKKYYYITYRPETRQNSKEYIKGVDVVLPQTANGCLYECVSGGISASTPPTFLTKENGTTEDGDVLWKCKPANTLLKSGDVITSSTWSGPAWVTIDNDTTLINNSITACRVTAVTTPTGTTTMTLTNHILVTRSSGRLEELERSLIITIAEG